MRPPCLGTNLLSLFFERGASQALFLSRRLKRRYVAIFRRAGTADMCAFTVHVAILLRRMYQNFAYEDFTRLQSQL